jgi:hypothetical protein
LFPDGGKIVFKKIRNSRRRSHKATPADVVVRKPIPGEITPTALELPRYVPDYHSRAQDARQRTLIAADIRARTYRGRTYCLNPTCLKIVGEGEYGDIHGVGFCQCERPRVETIDEKMERREAVIAAQSTEIALLRHDLAIANARLEEAETRELDLRGQLIVAEKHIHDLVAGLSRFVGRAYHALGAAA